MAPDEQLINEMAAEISNLTAQAIENERTLTTIQLRLDTVLQKLEAIEQRVDGPAKKGLFGR
ncbi:hypothetical protein [Pseudoduganella lutea]|uniref:SlyX protein n=1 Tax=Pseudoduganella lutea TaxID=321985 RepID=A0A4P6L5E7_9BURK|nr:hypothetical protein [Pseudoduganella lutea]QBE66859.1 hypothetical protein EWM63_31025 [Pseudoduganella lutea]